MSVTFFPAGFLALAWFVASLFVAARILRRPGDAPQAERAMLAGAAALIGFAPVVWFLVARLAGETSWFAGGLQLAVAGVLIGAAALGRLRRRGAIAAMSRLHFNEKSALIILAALLIVFGGFAQRAWGADDAVILGAFGRAIIEFVVFVVIGHVIASLTHAPQAAVHAEADERDREITLASSRNAYYLLFAGFVSLPFYAVFQPSVAGFVVTWTAVLVLSELVYYGSVLAYYRLGVN